MNISVRLCTKIPFLNTFRSARAKARAAAIQPFWIYTPKNTAIVAHTASRNQYFQTEYTLYFTSTRSTAVPRRTISIIITKEEDLFSTTGAGPSTVSG